MMLRSIRYGGLVVVLAAGVCLGQERPAGDEPDQPKHRMKRRAKKPENRNRGPRAEILVKELDLEERQEAVIRKIFDKYYKTNRELRESSRPTPETEEELKELRERVREARVAGDEERLRELRERRRAIQEDRRKRHEPIRERREAAMQRLHDQIIEVLRRDQKDRFEEIWQQWTAPRKLRAPRRSPRALRVVVDKLPDLTPEMKQGVDALFDRHRRASHGLEKKSPEYESLNKRLYDDVVALLGPKQKDWVENRLSGRSGPSRNRVRINGKVPGLQDKQKPGRRAGDKENPDDS